MKYSASHQLDSIFNGLDANCHMNYSAASHQLESIFNGLYMVLLVFSHLL